MGFSKIASAIGKPIHIDEATAKKKRLDFARICVEINAEDELPNDITISVNSDSVMVGVEYQWLPPKCESCKVFGHACTPKIVPNHTKSEEEEWVVVGKGKLSTASVEVGEQVAATASSSNSASAMPGQKDELSHPIKESNSPLLLGTLNINPPDLSNQPTLLQDSQVSPRSPDSLVSDERLLDEGFSAKVEEIKHSTSVREGGQQTTSLTTNKGPAITTPGGLGRQGIKESNSSKKKRLKKERKLRNQGSF